jgi:hypothetical protein
MHTAAGAELSMECSMAEASRPLSIEQQQALLRFLGSRAESKIVMAGSNAHYVPIQGEGAMKLTNSFTLPGSRTVRYALHGETIFVADVDGPEQV